MDMTKLAEQIAVVVRSIGIRGDNHIGCGVQPWSYQHGLATFWRRLSYRHC
jgi:hypothetical protein